MIKEGEVIIDAIFGYGLNREVDWQFSELIYKIKELKAEQGEEIVEKVATEFSDVSFDDLGSDKAE